MSHDVLVIAADRRRTADLSQPGNGCRPEDDGREKYTLTSSECRDVVEKRLACSRTSCSTTVPPVDSEPRRNAASDRGRTRFEPLDVFGCLIRAPLRARRRVVQRGVERGAR